MVATVTDQTQLTWPVARLRPNPNNPRQSISDESVQELADSIRAQGILQPLLVTPSGTVVAGHRRLAAARLAGLVEVPVVVRDMSESEMLTVMLAENIQRADIDAVQEARAYQWFVSRGCPQADIARMVGVTGSRVQSRLLLLRLDEQVQELFARGELPTTLGPVLARVADVHQQRRLATLSARRKLSVAQLRGLVDRGLGEPVKKTNTVKPEEDQQAGLTHAIGRTEAMELLASQPKRTVTHQQLADLFDAVCGVCASCGMVSLKEVCVECPGPQMIQALVRDKDVG